MELNNSRYDKTTEPAYINQANSITENRNRLVLIDGNKNDYAPENRQEDAIMSAEELVEQLDIKNNGQVKGTFLNCMQVFQRDSLLHGIMKYNAFTQKIDVLGQTPWERIDKGRTVTDSDFREIHLYFEQNYGISNANAIREAMCLSSEKNQFHPIRDYLNGLQWDGKQRIRFCLNHFLGADTSNYTFEVFKLFLLGAISRAFEPGTKFDNMLCLFGGQGIGKSSFLRMLSVKDEWFCDDMNNLESDKAYQRIQGHWIIEMSELTALTSARSNEAIKSFLSRDKDTYRIPYDRFPEDRPRQCVFGGTTNKKQFLPADRSGNRRFLPIDCDGSKKEVFILDDEQSSRAYIDQIWAEAMMIYHGEDYSLKLSKEMESELVERQQAHMPEDVDAGLILSFMRNTKEERVCSFMLYAEALGNGNRSPNKKQTNEICDIVNELIRSGDLDGWRAFHSAKRFKPYGTQKGWERIPD